MQHGHSNVYVVMDDVSDFPTPLGILDAYMAVFVDSVKVLLKSQLFSVHDSGTPGVYDCRPLTFRYVKLALLPNGKLIFVSFQVFLLFMVVT